eukprot:gene13558-28770_t
MGAKLTTEDFEHSLEDWCLNTSALNHSAMLPHRSHSDTETDDNTPIHTTVVDTQRIMMENDILVHGLHNLSYIISEHIKAQRGDIHHIIKILANEVVAIETSMQTDDDNGNNTSGMRTNTVRSAGINNVIALHTNGSNTSHHITVASLASQLTPNGCEALHQAQIMLAELQTLIADSRSYSQSQSVSENVFRININNNGHNNGQIDNDHENINNKDDGSFLTEIFYKVRLKQGLELDVHDINGIITIVLNESITMKIITKEDKLRLEWIKTLRAATFFNYY